MDAFGAKIVTIFFAAVISAAFLAGRAVAAEAPAPAPTSAAYVVSPPLAVAFFTSFVVFLLGFLRQ